MLPVPCEGTFLKLSYLSKKKKKKKNRGKKKTYFRICFNFNQQVLLHLLFQLEYLYSSWTNKNLNEVSTQFDAAEFWNNRNLIWFLKIFLDKHVAENGWELKAFSL